VSKACQVIADTLLLNQRASPYNEMLVGYEAAA
jgi:hypothetical protein